MSGQTVEAARAAMEALSHRDLATLTALSHDDVEWHSFFAALNEGGAYRGRDGLRQYLTDLTEAFEIVDAQVDDDISLGDVVVLVGRIHYRGKESGVEQEMPAGWLLKFRGDKIVRFRAFREPEAALEAIGLAGGPG
jgi:ketosteroid isomerase-like protein